MKNKFVRTLKDMYFNPPAGVEAFFDEGQRIGVLLGLMLDKLEEMGAILDMKVWELSVFDDTGSLVKNELHTSKKGATLKATKYANRDWVCQIIERKLNVGEM